MNKQSFFYSPDSDGSCHWIIWMNNRVNSLQEFIHIQNLIQVFFTLLNNLQNTKPQKITPAKKRRNIGMESTFLFDFLQNAKKQMCSIPFSFAWNIDQITHNWQKNNLFTRYERHQPALAEQNWLKLGRDISQITLGIWLLPHTVLQLYLIAVLKWK